MCTRVTRGQEELLPWEGRCGFFDGRNENGHELTSTLQTLDHFAVQVDFHKTLRVDRKSVNKGLDCRAVLNNIDQGTPLQCLLVDAAPSVESII